MVNKISKMNLIIVLLFCGLVLLVTGCTPILQIFKQTPEPEAFTPNLKPDEYSTEIVKLKKVIKSHPEQSERIKASFHLASLYSSYKNPQKDYKKALEQLNLYISLNPKAAKQYDVQNRLSLLREITRLSGKNMERKQAIEKLKQTIKELKQTIEELKHLDRQLEQKRKRYR
jgi:chromosome segregation ATPase